MQTVVCGSDASKIFLAVVLVTVLRCFPSEVK